MARVEDFVPRGVIPAVLRYYNESCPGADAEGIETFLLAATAIGALIKLNASISGAESIRLSPSRSHCTAAPEIKQLPSSA